MENDNSGGVGGGAPEIKSTTRRSFLGVLLGFGTVIMGAALSIPLIRFAFTRC